ncbi:alpha/beta hydrolase [Actinomadura fibrosa]|uniref:Alpha/beta hydrolase n=1 Tax=Actinomadura fibrosa TaxID=111802 RepID=A0ABW2XT09_9ACTN|nr:alpha/beta fold hydrolase [Actinomadura fibrosa]
MAHSLRIGRPVLALLVTCAALVATAMPVSAAVKPACTTHRLNVRIADPGPADQTMWGQLCYPPGTRPKKVQLLVHGSLYNHVYWDFPVGNGTYSYVRAAVGAGYATFNVDRIGNGDSSHPPSARLDIPAGAVALHDAIGALRSGALDGNAFTKVAWVGHSNGSFHAWYEISRYHDVDAAVLTGSLHGINPVAGTIIYPAAQDPKFAASGLDPGYVTSLPGTRDFFYDPATSEQAVIDTDEATKDVATLTPSPAPPDPIDIGVPILLMSGVRDKAQCVGITLYDCADPASVRAYESQFYRPDVPLTVAMIPATGHDLALSTTAPQSNAIALAWIRSNLK